MNKQDHSPAARFRRPRVLFLAGGLGLVLAVWCFREPLRQHIAEHATLTNDAPSPELVMEMIENSEDRAVAVLAAWNSGKIVHREAALRGLSNVIPISSPLPPELDGMLQSAALDPDLNVRETAFTILRSRNHPASTTLASAQLHDADPHVRLLGLNLLKHLDPATSVPLVVPLLNDPDPLIVVMTLKVLEKAGGEDFGVKLRDAAMLPNAATDLNEPSPVGLEKTREGAQRALAWWENHRTEYKPAGIQPPDPAWRERPPVSAGDFELRSLEGRRVRLADFRGRVVLLNFWTTWCTACVAEMPELVALQKKHADQVTVLGISLDFVPDSHGHLGGHAAVEEQQDSPGDHHDGERNNAALRRVREKIARTARARKVNYPILLDEENAVGGRFNGGELPTTVIVDADGYVRRRFVGTRSRAAFEAMIAEASAPWGNARR